MDNLYDETYEVAKDLLEEKESGGGLRFNEGKLELSECPNSLIYAVAKVMMFGASKYAKHNWRKGMKWSIPRDCLQRHLTAWDDGEECDKESRLSHLYHAAANIAMLIEYEHTFPELDDRFKGKVRKKEDM